MIVARAPGKLVLAGEYAVLTGAPAIVAAVDRDARVEVTEAPACRVRIAGPEVPAAEFSFDREGRIEWQSPGSAGDYPLLAAVMETLAGVRELPVGRRFVLRLDTGAFFADGRKLGLGSSAALTVALTAALCRFFRFAFEPALAYSAHRRLQGGTGSGLDVAAALSGGVIGFRMGDAAPDIERLRWPDGVAAAFFWSGRAATTVARVRRFTGWASNEASSPLLMRLNASAEAVARAWRNAEPETVLQATAGWRDALEDVARAADIDIFGAGHAELTALGRRLGVVYKPSGAGGGDFGVAFAADAGRLRSFTHEACGAGFEHIDLVPDAEGLRTVE